ncbi:MAG: aldo/keto reductase [Gemmatimonadota bacterium]
MYSAGKACEIILTSRLVWRAWGLAEVVLAVRLRGRAWGLADLSLFCRITLGLAAASAWTVNGLCWRAGAGLRRATPAPNSSYHRPGARKPQTGALHFRDARKPPSLHPDKSVMTSRIMGLGCMRLSTNPPSDAVHVIHAALDAGATLLDTADAYCQDETDTGHNERLIASSLRSWSGDRSRIEVATKGGIVRPNGEWVPDGRAKHLRTACEASLRALGVETIDLYQLHTVDPRTPLATSVRALAALQREGKIRRIGLSNVTVSQIEAARSIAEISAVQVSLSALDDENFRNGVVRYCCDQGLQLIAYRPLGGRRTERLTRDPVLAGIAARHGVSAQEVALRWLLDLQPLVVPIPGATRVATARSIATVLALRLDDQDHEQLAARIPAARVLSTERVPPQVAIDGAREVVLVMGMPGAGKSTVAEEFVAQGYRRLNRDAAGGTLASLANDLDTGLRAGAGNWVLDNTYAARAARHDVIACAARHGARVRCVRLRTSLADAQVNAVTRLIEARGSLPAPEEIRARSRSDHRYFGPDAQFRYERQAEPPVIEEGFAAIEERPFVRRPNPAFDRAAVIFEYDGVLCTSPSGAAAILDPDDIVVTAERRAEIARCQEAGLFVLAIAWRPQISAGQTSVSEVEAVFERTRALLGTNVDIAVCPHAAGPPVCWCRKPLPGLVLQFAHRYRLALGQTTLVGRSQADRTLAARLGMRYTASAT